ncbi:MAG: SDR family oxidoreductase [Kiloniellales bacterium]
MDFGLKGRNALVLASSRGLGRAVAEELAAEGARVFLCGRSAERLTLTCKAIRKRGGECEFLALDLTDEESAGRLYQAANAALGEIDILVNNTGGPPPGPIVETQSKAWRHQFEAMVLRVIEIANLSVPGMRARSWGRIVTIASSGVIQSIPNLGLSNALRSALVGWSKTLSNELAADGITVNMVVPGRIHTERIDELDAATANRQGKTVEEVVAASRSSIPAGRYGRVEELAAVVAFICSVRASYMTGSILRVDGGAIRSV